MHIEIGNGQSAIGNSEYCFKFLIIFKLSKSHLFIFKLLPIADCPFTIHHSPLSIHDSPKKDLYNGIGLAVLAAIIWSGNFIVARGVYKDIPPVTLNFFRWLTASVIIFPFAVKQFNVEKAVMLQHWKYLFWVALTGIALFNTFVYVAGHYTTAINMALIGTTSSPVIATFLAAVFLKEKIRPLRICGLLICVTGIIILLSKGSMETLVNFRFSTGDWWMLLGATFFAIYNTLVRCKPASISSLTFLFASFLIGTVMLLPFSVWEMRYHAPLIWNIKLISVIAYIGIGASVISYLCWNLSIARLGSSRTALFGNLIPVFSALEAVVILHERLLLIHIVSGLIVITGLVIANLKKANSVTPQTKEIDLKEIA